MSLPWSVSAALGMLLLGATSTHPVKPKPKAKARHHSSHGVQHKRPIPLSHAPGSRAEAYGQLAPATCLALLDQRHIPYSREEPKRGVKIPVRLTGKVGGVLYRTDFPDAERASVPWEIFDCRLVLSLDDFSETLRAHSIVEVRMFSAWRPPAKTWPMSDVARRHQGALAIDVRELRKDNGEVLNVLDDFHGQLGGPLCVPAATPAEIGPPAGPRAPRAGVRGRSGARLQQHPDAQLQSGPQEPFSPRAHARRGLVHAALTDAASGGG